MNDTDTQKLLADFVNHGSDPAFRELVTRYIDLVYSAATRLVDGDTHLAEDITQTVFADLARKARTLSREVMLGGWLHRHTCYIAASILRRDRRRQSRERQAVAMNTQPDHSAANLALVAPLLDAAIDQLEPEDRTAILLRYFEQRDFRSVGQALGSNEDAARMRVNRALDKLHTLMKHHGLACSAAVLAATLAGGVVTAAPAGLAATVAGTALTGAAVGGTVLAIIKSMNIMKLALIGTVAVAAIATPVVMQQSAAKLRAENQTLRQQTDQLANLHADNDRLSNLLTQANNTLALSEKEKSELLKLRGEVGLLRRQQSDLEKLRAENTQLRTAITTMAKNTTPVRATAGIKTVADIQCEICINNLRQIDGASQQCALERHLTATNIVTAADIAPYLGHLANPKFPTCPSGGTYTFGSLTNDPTCSIPGHTLQ
ncbi:MAG: polymerase, sigma-24 subunit, subfamily [Pedosphaera sp.]|nr:polymerase, sigma-24 subunit, subfamily [Pedosphaera sp.]